MTIVRPVSGTKITGLDGVEVTITACGLTTGESGWLLDDDPGDGIYTFDGTCAAITADGTTTYNDTPVGSPGDVDYDTKLTLVLANIACITALDSMDLQRSQPTSLPPTCRS